MYADAPFGPQVLIEAAGSATVTQPIKPSGEFYAEHRLGLGASSHPLSDRVWLHSLDSWPAHGRTWWYFDVSRDSNFGGRKGRSVRVLLHGGGTGYYYFCLCHLVSLQYGYTLLCRGHHISGQLRDARCDVVLLRCLACHDGDVHLASLVLGLDPTSARSARSG